MWLCYNKCVTHVTSSHTWTESIHSHYVSIRTLYIGPVYSCVISIYHPLPTIPTRVLLNHFKVVLRFNFSVYGDKENVHVMDFIVVLKVMPEG